MVEEDFFEETNVDNSPCSVYREFLMEEIGRIITPRLGLCTTRFFKSLAK